ncbi:MAG: PQQ-binding-like beta-propeller repeat protein [Acidobacteriota bacterium]
MQRNLVHSPARIVLASLFAFGLPLVAAASTPVELPPLDDGLASFGGAVAGDSLYVYGGHIGGTHKHSKANLSHRFQRLDLANPTAWQDLGEDIRGLQGLALVAHDGRVCRIGGLDARNPTLEQEADLISVDEVTCYDPSKKAWIELPPLPAPRSSHDAAVMGDRIFVAGGWQLRGAGEEAVWHDDLLVLDLAAEQPSWRSIPQPFQRRALTVATADGKVFVCGGLGPDGTSLRVDVYDPEAEVWSVGPELKIAVGPMHGFGVSAFGVDDKVMLSGGDGVIFELAPGADDWVKVGKLETARFFHRLLPHQDRLLFVAGAGAGGHLGSTEVVERAALGPAPPKVQTVGFPWRWPGYRGANGNGYAPSERLPTRWSLEDGVEWTVALPGYGQSAPVVWDNQVFVTSVEGDEKETSIVSALDAETGEVRWRRRFDGSQRIPNTEMYSRAAPTPVVDDNQLYVFFETGDVIVLDHSGETLWRRTLTSEFGEFQGNHGVASSPVLAGDSLIVQVTHEGPSYFLALDRADGSVRWKADREPGVAWTTPLVVLGDDGYEIVSSAAGRVEALDAATGESLWSIDGIEKNNVPSPTLADDLLVVASSDPSHNQALRRAEGGGVEVVWRAEGIASGFGSPIRFDDTVLITNRKGVVAALDLETGEVRWRHRLPESVWATPVVAGDRAYFFTKKGETVVLRVGETEPEILATNSLPTEQTVYGVAAVEDAFLVRSGDELVRIGSPETQAVDSEVTEASAVARLDE